MVGEDRPTGNYPVRTIHAQSDADGAVVVYHHLFDRLVVDFLVVDFRCFHHHDAGTPSRGGKGQESHENPFSDSSHLNLLGTRKGTTTIIQYLTIFAQVLPVQPLTGGIMNEMMPPLIGYSTIFMHQ